MSKITNDEYIKSLPQNVQALGVYVNSRTKVKVKCKVCEHIWDAPSRSFKKGHGCPECGKRKALLTKNWNITQECFLNKIPPDLLKNINVLDTYVDLRTDLNVKCLRCDNVWVSQPCRLYRGDGCDKCARKNSGIKNRKSHKQFVAEIEDIHDGSLELLSNYTLKTEKVKVRCLICTYEFEKIAHRLLSRGCPNCVCSKGERKIGQIFKQNNIEYIAEYSFEDLISVKGVKLRFDFAVFKNKKLSHLIEYDGIQHFAPLGYSDGLAAFNRLRTHDHMKNEYCRVNNINLIRIPFTLLHIINLEMLMTNV